MPPKRKAGPASSTASKRKKEASAQGDEVNDADPSSSMHVAKRARTERRTTGDSGRESGAIEGPMEGAIAEHGKAKKRQGKPIRSTKKKAQAQSSTEEVQATAALRGPREGSSKARGRKLKVKSAGHGEALEGGQGHVIMQKNSELVHENENEDNVTVIESQGHTQTQPSDGREIDRDELVHTPEEGIPPTQAHLDPHIHPHMPYPPPPSHSYYTQSYAHVHAHPDHPFSTGYPPHLPSHPPHHPHYPPGPPPGIDYSASSFNTIDTGQEGSFPPHAPYIDGNGAPAGDPFPPPGTEAHGHHMYPPPPPEGYPIPPPAHHVQRDQPRAGSSGQVQEEGQSSSEQEDDGNPEHEVSFIGADGRKLVPVRGGGRATRADHVACHFCRGRKLKCDGRRPACGHCSLRSLACRYDPFIRRRGPGKKVKNVKRKQDGSTPEGSTSGVPIPDAVLEGAGMHIGTIDPRATSASPVDLDDLGEGPSQAPQYDATALPVDPNLSSASRHVGPLPTPDPPKNPLKRRRSAGQPVIGGVQLKAAILKLRDDGTGGTMAGAIGELKPSRTAYSISSNEKLDPTGGANVTREAPSRTNGGQFYYPSQEGYVYHRGGDDTYGDDEADDEGESFVGSGAPHARQERYASATSGGWPSEPPGGI